MRNFLKAEVYYLRKDTSYRAVSIIFLLASILLPIWIGTKSGFALSNPIEPLRLAVSLSFILYFIIPLHACYFATEGFEYGSVKNIIASGRSRLSYFIGKYISELKVIGWWMIQFFGLYYALYMALVLITGSPIDRVHFQEHLTFVVSALFFNLLYLSAYAAIVMMVGILIKKTASAIVVTFTIIFGDFLLSGYFKDSASTLLRTVSEHTLMTQIFKFCGQYVIHSQLVTLSGINDYIRTMLIAVTVIAVCLVIAMIAFNKSDIHT